MSEGRTYYWQSATDLVDMAEDAVTADEKNPGV